MIYLTRLILNGTIPAMNCDQNCNKSATLNTYSNEVLVYIFFGINQYVQKKNKFNYRQYNDFVSILHFLIQQLNYEKCTI